LSETLLVLELADSPGSLVEVLLDEVDGVLVNDELGGLLEERIVFLEVILEESSGLGDDGSGLLEVSDLLVELVVGFGSFGIQLVDFLLVILGLLPLGGDDSLHDGSSGVEISLEGGFELDSLGVGFGDVFIVGGDVGVADLLEGVVAGIVFLLLSDVSVFDVVEGGHEGVEWV
jgi:hypothetical protein